MVLRLWVCRRKEPILGYVPKNDEKKNLVYKGLNNGTNLSSWSEYLFATSILSTFKNFL